jgi:hypothetical protein
MLEVDRQIEGNLMNPDLIKVAERMRVRPNPSGTSRIIGARHRRLGRVGHAQTNNRQRQQSHDNGGDGIHDGAPDFAGSTWR